MYYICSKKFVKIFIKLRQNSVNFHVIHSNGKGNHIEGGELFTMV